MIMVQEGDAAPEGPEYRHGLTPAMRDARRRHFRCEPDISPDLVQQVENDLQSIMAGGTARDVDAEVVEKEEDAHNRHEAEKPAPRTAVASKKAKAGDGAVAAAPPAATDEPKGDGDDDFDDQMEEEEDND